jgi:hypothetical protein
MLECGVVHGVDGCCRPAPMTGRLADGRTIAADATWLTQPKGLMDNQSTAAPPVCAVWKKRLGLGLLLYSFAPLCTVEFVAFLPLSTAQAVTFGAIYIASGEIACLAAVALLGKPFLEGVKERLKRFFRRAGPPSPPRPIGRLRHNTGVALLLGSLVPYYAALGMLLLGQPGPSGLRGTLYLLLAGEGLFFLGLALLGGEFWARLKKLFEWPGQDRPQDAGGAGADAGRT